MADTNGNASFEQSDTAANTAQALAVDATSNRLLGFTQSLTSVRGTQTLSTVNSAVNYSLDAAGNLSSDGLRAFAYDAINRHTSTRSPAGADTATVQYLFNALGQRVFKSTVSLSSGTGVVSGGTNTATGSLTPMPTLGQFYSYADDSEGAGNSSSGSNANLPSYAMLGEYCNGASGCVQQEYLWLPLDNGQAIPIGLLRSSRLYAIHTDHLGTPRLIHDDSNTPVWQWAYSAFGENAPSGALKATTNVNAVFALGANNAKLALSAPAVTVNLRFAGQYADSESNLFQNGFRSYAPAIGSYSQMDPIGLGGGFNRRGYVGGNAFGATDAFGLMGNGPSGGYKSTPVNKGGSHNYSWRVFRCMGDCRAQTMRELRCNPAPGVSPKDPINSGDVNTVNLGPMELGPIKTVIDPASNTSSNITMPGHMLHPGWVNRVVVFDGSATWVVNDGGGTGFNPLNLNTVLAPIVWGGENPKRLPEGACGCE
jgi:RHS repeat-associated protein